jgi:hypothetical protein
VTLRATRVLFALSLLSVPLAAQGNLSVTGGPVAFAAPTTADFDAGFIDAGSALTYQVSLSGFYFLQNHTSTVSIRASGSTLNGTTPIGTLTWRRGDLTTWNSLATSDVTVESRSYSRFTAQTPWSNQLFFRLNLSYSGDPPGTYSATVVITLTETTP